MTSLHFCLDEDTVFEFAIDSAANVKTINDLFERDGTTAVLIQYQPDDPPALGKLHLNFRNDDLIQSV